VYYYFVVVAAAGSDFSCYPGECGASAVRGSWEIS